MVLFAFIASIGFVKVLIFSVGAYVLYRIIAKLLAIRVTSKQRYTFLEVKPSYKSLKSAFSTEQLFSILHTIQRPTSLTDRILGIKRTMSFEIVSTKEDGIRYILRLPSQDIEIVKKALLAYVPSIEINEIYDYLMSYNENLIVRQLKLSKSYVFSLQAQSILKEFDPIGYITAQMTKLEKNELIALQIVNTAVSTSTHSKVIDQIQTLKQMLLNNEDISTKLQTGFVWFLLKVFYPSKKKQFNELSRSKHEIYKSIEDKINQPLYETTIRLLIKSDHKDNTNKRIKGLLSSSACCIRIKCIRRWTDRLARSEVAETSTNWSHTNCQPARRTGKRISAKIQFDRKDALLDINIRYVYWRTGGCTAGFRIVQGEAKIIRPIGWIRTIIQMPLIGKSSTQRSLYSEVIGNCLLCIECQDQGQPAGEQKQYDKIGHTKKISRLGHTAHQFHGGCLLYSKISRMHFFLHHPLRVLLCVTDLTLTIHPNTIVSAS